MESNAKCHFILISYGKKQFFSFWVKWEKKISKDYEHKWYTKSGEKNNLTKCFLTCQIGFFVFPDHKIDQFCMKV